MYSRRWEQRNSLQKDTKKSKIILNPINDKYIGVPEPAERRKTVVQSGRLVDFKTSFF